MPFLEKDRSYVRILLVDLNQDLKGSCCVVYKYILWVRKIILFFFSMKLIVVSFEILENMSMKKDG